MEFFSKNAKYFPFWDFQNDIFNYLFIIKSSFPLVDFCYCKSGVRILLFNPFQWFMFYISFVRFL